MKRQGCLHRSSQEEAGSCSVGWHMAAGAGRAKARPAKRVLGWAGSHTQPQKGARQARSSKRARARARARARETATYSCFVEESEREREGAEGVAKPSLPGLQKW